MIRKRGVSFRSAHEVKSHDFHSDEFLRFFIVFLFCFFAFNFIINIANFLIVVACSPAHLSCLPRAWGVRERVARSHPHLCTGRGQAPPPHGPAVTIESRRSLQKQGKDFSNNIVIVERSRPVQPPLL